MIKKWIPIETVIDSWLDEIDDDIEGEGSIKRIERQVKRAAYDLYSKCQVTLMLEEFSGTISKNMIELPETYCKYESLSVEGKPVTVGGMQKHLRGNVLKGTEAQYTAKIVGEWIMFNVIGGTYNLEGKPYLLEVKTVPKINGTLYVPIQFEKAIISDLTYRSMKKKVMKNGRGEGILTSFYKIKNAEEQEAIMDVEFPSWDEMIQIGNIWESKVPKGLKSGVQNNFTNS